MITGPSTNNGTMISYSEGTMVQHDTGPGTAQSKTMSEIGKFSHFPLHNAITFVYW